MEQKQLRDIIRQERFILKWSSGIQSSEEEMECWANSIELFEKELSLVHHSNRLETRDTGKTRPNQKLSFHTLSNSR